MREIKFRVFIKWLKIILEVESIDFIKKRVYCKTGIKKQNPCDFYNLDEVILMQYIGLKDKNGVEIYEGDIVKDDKGRFFEVKEDLRFAKTGYIMSCIKNKLNDHINLGGFYDFWSWLYPDNDIEAIGNIYENKDLLES